MEGEAIIARPVPLDLISAEFNTALPWLNNCSMSVLHLNDFQFLLPFARLKVAKAIVLGDSGVGKTSLVNR